MHISIPIANTMEYINTREVSPLISKCLIKVCYVGQHSNRNGTVITKELAERLGKKLPGSPIVGYYNEETADFDGHTRKIKITEDGELVFIDMTKPYGFVPTDAKIWFQKFIDDGIAEREYLVTEGYIWAGIYPESQRIVEHGNNQSMELTQCEGTWTKDFISGDKIFIYNEALIEKLCILGEDIEPCFEGAQIKKEFSLVNIELKEKMLFMMEELQRIISEGGTQSSMMGNTIVLPENYNIQETPTIVDVSEDNNGTTVIIKENQFEELQSRYNALETEKNALEQENNSLKEFKNTAEALQVENDSLKEEKANYEATIANLTESNAQLETENNSLKEFKLNVERKEKEAMINSFYMLEEEDKKDVVENIETYSLEDIKAKLSVICFDKKVNFNINEDKDNDDTTPNGLFHLDLNMELDSAPDWVKAVRETANKI